MEALPGIKPDYVRLNEVQYHWKRKKEIAKSHPEVKQYFNKPYPLSAVYTVLMVAMIIYAGYMLKDASWWIIISVAYCLGAYPSHALWVMIHELTHDAVFKSKTLNKIFLCVANIAHLIPSAISFADKHKQHHAYLGETYEDPDLALPIEDAIFGHSKIGKAIWLFLFPVSMTVRQALSPIYSVDPNPTPFRLTSLHFWILFNWIFILATDVLIYYLCDIKGVAFIFIAFIAGLGFHPLGARWIAEHYAVISNGQETFSYYGYLNLITFNIGYHNEHHDFPTIAWAYLPTVSKIAPEYYENLHTHSSYIGLIWEFISNPKFTLRTRTVRDSHFLKSEKDHQKKE